MDWGILWRWFMDWVIVYVMYPEGKGTMKPSLGTHIYRKGSFITLVAIPEKDWYFDHWEINGDKVYDNPYKLKV